jgi:hypothetical protein
MQSYFFQTLSTQNPTTVKSGELLYPLTFIFPVRLTHQSQEGASIEPKKVTANLLDVGLI